ncbi:hypothetical protein BTO20_06000 [Mycobacterium dioxanotrophicus]|uniref:DUF1360 domain-containing protein n=1 Tax=Mycobacterium dioxanotrophicus TaxID=482462 RepID=A0A1Y0BZA1_9MYCO|nr:DUF1360 domain-containing protein [Mycobacterium dioxanotrophicus]ART68195.1 hypothetical protein BTO20_06000 [Mycobacterium dioxanotrophicus]
MSHDLGVTILILIVYVLAVMRLVRLVNFDTVLDPLRIRIARRAQTAKSAGEEAEVNMQPIAAELHLRTMARWNTLAYFIGCPWCVGFWLSLATAIVPVVLVGWPWWAAFGVALATSHLVGLAAPLSADEDIEIVENDE